jgi:integrase
MAALQHRNGSFRILFRFHGKQYAFTLGRVAEDEAETKRGQVDYLLLRLKQRLISLPEGVDIVTFLEFDGKPPVASSGPLTAQADTTLLQLKERYLETHGNGSLEANSLATCGLHLGHFCRVLGKTFPLPDLSLARMQSYVNKRSQEGIAPVTIRKEISTLRAAWNWGVPMNLTTAPFPSPGLRYPKTDEKPPFMTRTEIERQITGGMTEHLWECLYLNDGEIKQLLAFVKKHATQPWLYPLVATAAHTGARRSELLRALVTDVNLSEGTLLIREKKRSRSERTYRRVPLTRQLKKVLQRWLAQHPGGGHLFVAAGVLAHSKKRSPTTGHRGERARPTSLVDRRATVKLRSAMPPASGLTKDEVHDHFKRTLANSPWKVLRGLHVLRHSFISACASKGIDQRLIDEWVGHQTDQQRKRYRHLYPSTQQEAIRRVFA